MPSFRLVEVSLKPLAIGQMLSSISFEAREACSELDVDPPHSLESQNACPSTLTLSPRDIGLQMLLGVPITVYRVQ